MQSGAEFCSLARRSPVLKHRRTVVRRALGFGGQRRPAGKGTAAMGNSVADKCSEMPKQGVIEILGKFKDELRGEFVKVDIEMKLTDGQQAELERFLKKLE